MRPAEYVRDEPVRVVGGAAAAVSAVLFALSAYGVWSPTEEQVKATLALVAVVGPWVTRFLRDRVKPVYWHEREAGQAVEDALRRRRVAEALKANAAEAAAVTASTAKKAAKKA